jgi:hypothetical protein
MAVWSTVGISALGHAQRIEAEYYRPTYLEVAAQLEAANSIPLTRFLAYLTDGTHVTPKYVSKGIPFLSSSDIDPFIVSPEIEKFISEEEHARLRHCQPDAGDILMSKSGRIGTCAVVSASIKKGDWNIYEGVALLRIAGVDPYFVVAFLNSKYGYSQIRRELKGVAQPHLHLEDIRRLKLFVPTNEAMAAISGLVTDGVERARRSHLLFQSAQQLLGLKLGLDKLTFQKPVGFTAQFSDLETSHRSDAHHYQPRFKQLIDHLSGFPSARVRDIRSLNRRGHQPIYLRNGAVDVINSQHLGPKHINYEGLEKTSAKSFAAAPEAHIQKDDLLIYTTGAYIGRTNVYLSDAPALASNHVNIVRLHLGIDAAYMALVFQSIVGQFQTQQHARGSAQAELYPSDIDRFVVPLLDPTKQKAIGDLVRESLVKQQESRQLLEQAKARVEQLIEEVVQS